MRQFTFRETIGKKPTKTYTPLLPQLYIMMRGFCLEYYSMLCKKTDANQCCEQHRRTATLMMSDGVDWRGVQFFHF